MAQQYTDPTALDGLFKEVYGEDIIDLVPEVGKLIKMLPWSSDDEEGDSYHQPVVLSYEHGVTYAAGDAGAFSLKDHVAQTMKDANLKGSQILLRSALSYDAAAKASRGGKKAFKKATEHLVENMMKSITKRVELSILYGQSLTGIGQPESTSNVDSDTTTFTISDATWAPGIWAGLEGATLDLYDDMDGTPTLVNTNAKLVVASVDLDSKTVTVDGNSTDITAIDALTYGGDEALLFEGAYGNEMAGIDKIITNTGTLFGISAATYNLWKGNTQALGGTPTFGKILQGVSKGVARGLDEKAALVVPPIAYESLNDDMAALRQYDSSYKRSKGELGVETITYMGQNGEIEIIPHILIKEGEFFLFPPKKLKRVGAQDISFKTPGMSEKGNIFRHLESRAGYELRVYTDQAILGNCPATFVKYTGATYT